MHGCPYVIRKPIKLRTVTCRIISFRRSCNQTGSLRFIRVETGASKIFAHSEDNERRNVISVMLWSNLFYEQNCLISVS
jgi:hypothetical protein